MREELEARKAIRVAFSRGGARGLYYRIVEEILRATLIYFTREKFLTCDSFHDESYNYMTEILDVYEPNPASDADGCNPSFRSLSHLSKINFRII